jgi:prepilin peptidase CpaA
MLSKIASLHQVQALAVVMPILVLVVIDDLRNFRIRNQVVLALLVLFGVFYMVNGDLAAFTSHLLFGLAMFALCLVMYRFGMMGGGDVKLLAVAFLWMGIENATVFAMLLGMLAMGYAAGASFHLLPYRTDNGRVKVPYGPTISLAWIGASLASIIL